MIDGDLNMSIPVIGLDRDGTINEDIGLTQEGIPPYVIKPEQFKPIPGSLEAVKMIRDKGYDVVILTLQVGELYAQPKLIVSLSITSLYTILSGFI